MAWFKLPTFEHVNKALTSIISTIINEDYDKRHSSFTLGDYNELIVCIYCQAYTDPSASSVAKVIAEAANKGYKMLVVEAEEDYEHVSNYAIGVKDCLFDNDSDWTDPDDFTTEYVMGLILTHKLEKHILAKATELDIKRAHG